MTTLALLRNELPDPDVSLYKQVLHNFDAFTLFPKLPVELRLAIWSYTFKPRRVELSQRFWKTDLVRHKAKSTPPIAMHINKESRDFTSEHYLVLLRDFKDHNRTIYIHPELDTLALPTLKIFEFEQLRGSAFSSVVCKIQHLELHHMWWSDTWTSVIGEGVNIVPESDAYYPFYCTWIKRFREEMVVRAFPVLQKLDLVVKMNGRIGLLDTEKGRRDCEESFKKFMGRLAVEIPGYKVPEVSVLS
ncbi:uncharacterized protein PAC_10090 [Phialocephala subalpina]|uniref:2EXR domain-containing protein n=1 Tax=Phialocephala subalpina TaxID=576137 RepID=A0A1L7X597_9HELO|nr:uncharacterized protein PAC_10090 [Phialocephala subalpina]